MAKKTGKRLDGGDVLYHLFWDILSASDQTQYRRFVKTAIDTLGVWLSPDVYRRLPIIFPYAHRDTTCRQDRTKGRPEAWGSPDENGYFRDDNTLIKNLANSLEIVSPLRWYNGARGGGFIASHVWIKPTDFEKNNLRAAKRPELFSFVPNIMWLPSQISKLTDRDGGFAQHYIQAISYRLYRMVRLQNGLQEFADSCWEKLPYPDDVREAELPDPCSLTYFKYDQKKVDYRRKQIADLSLALREIERDGVSRMKILGSRYVPGLPNVSLHKRQSLKLRIDSYADALGVSVP